MKIKMMSLALAGAFAMNAGAALAEDVQFDGSWYLMPGVGVMHTDTDLQADDNSAAYSLRLGKQLAEHWDIQVGGSYAKADEDTNYPNSSGDYKQTLFGVDVCQCSDVLTSRRDMRKHMGNDCQTSGQGGCCRSPVPSGECDPHLRV
jgi:maltoporin